jgi:hypothetical protein
MLRGKLKDMGIANAYYFMERKKNNVTFFLFLGMNLNVASAANNLKIEEMGEAIRKNQID